MTIETRVGATGAGTEPVPPPRLSAVPNQPVKAAPPPPGAPVARGGAAPALKPVPNEPRVQPKTDMSVQRAISRAKRQRNRLVLGSLLAMVVIPTLIAAVYFFWIASDQYVSVAKFAVRGNQQVGVSDLMGFFTGGGSGSTAGDSYILEEFVGSRELVDRVDKSLGVRQMFERPDIDYFSRYHGGEQVEDFILYWQKMVSVSYDRYSGNVSLEVHAFSPTDAKAIADVVVRECDALINRITEKSRNDSVAFAQNEVAAMEARFKTAQNALEAFQATQSTVDPSAAAKANEEMIASLDEQLMKTQSQIDELSKFVVKDAPQMKVLRSRVDVIKAQLADRRKRVSADGPSSDGADAGIGAQLSAFKSLKIEEEFAQKAYVSAMTSLEIARANANRDQRYLATYVFPSVPQMAMLPERGKSTLLVLVATLILWGVGSLLYAAVRDHVI